MLPTRVQERSEHTSQWARVAGANVVELTMTSAMEASPAGNGKPRLVIQRLELENFKSYAGVQHIGPFHKVGSCVVQVLCEDEALPRT